MQGPKITILEKEGKSNMELMPGIIKESSSNYALYFIDDLSDELKTEIRNRLVAICHGSEQAKSSSAIYSYKETVKEFIRRYRTNNGTSENRKKGMIGELLVHIVLEIEDDFTTASPFFNMEERSFKKGYDVVLFERASNELWIAEVKAGERQKDQNNASSAVVGLINTAKNDLKKRLNASNTTLWLNALNAAKVSMSSSNSQKGAVIKLLEQCAADAVNGSNSSSGFNVVLSGTLFHPMLECMEKSEVGQKYSKVVNEKLFKKVIVMAIQKEAFTDIYDFLDSEVNDEI